MVKKCIYRLIDELIASVNNLDNEIRRDERGQCVT